MLIPDQVKMQCMAPRLRDGVQLLLRALSIAACSLTFGHPMYAGTATMHSSALLMGRGPNTLRAQQPGLFLVPAASSTSAGGVPLCSLVTADVLEDA